MLMSLSCLGSGKRPRRFEKGTSQGSFHQTPKDYYRKYYFETIDVLVNCIQDRFDQLGYKVYVTLESIMQKNKTLKKK